jgi:protein-L-isoaspartate(D-aspartate) O-methyltransferase
MINQRPWRTVPLGAKFDKRFSGIMIDFTTARRNMVDNQIRPNRVTSLALLDALLEVPRELFVPPTARGVAYVDDDIPLQSAPGRPSRWLMEPMVFARLVQAAGIDKTDVVLGVGAGCGYGAAVLSRLAATVVAVEDDPVLSEAATRTLETLKVDNVACIVGDPKKGCPAQAPYDVILFEGAIHRIPEEISAQLAEGGRLVAVLRNGAGGERTGVGQAILAERLDGKLSHRILFDAGTPYLPGFTPEPSFVF